MKTYIIRLIMVIAILTSFVSQSSAQSTGLGSFSDSFHIRHDYVSGESVTFSITSAMHVTMHTYASDQTPEAAPLSASADTPTVISVRDLSTGSLVARQTGSLYRKYVCDTYEACLVLPELPAGTYSVVVEGDEDSFLTVEGFQTAPPHSLDGREAGQPIDMGVFSSEFGYSHIRDTSEEGYWAGFGSPSNDVFYKFTITQPMYVVVNHWGTVPMSEYVPSRLAVLFCNPETGIIQTPPLGEVYDIYSTDNLMTDENLCRMLICPDQIPEIEHNSTLCASWHGRLVPGTYFVVSEGPYRLTNNAQAYNGPVRTNIRGFVPSEKGERKDIDAGGAADGVMEFQDSKFYGVASHDVIRYRFGIDSTAVLTVVTDASTVILEKDGTSLASTLSDGRHVWEELAPGEYTLSLTASTGRLVTTSISSEKFIPPYIPEVMDDKNNFVRVMRPFHEGTADPDRIDLGNSRQTIEYYDGLGRPVQTVLRRESPSGEDLATHIRYEYGRPVEEWNAAPAGKGKAMIPYSAIRTSAESAYMDNRPYKRTSYEDSPLSRVISVTGSGEDWHSAGKAVGYDYLVNDTTGVLSCLRFVPSSDYSEAAAPALYGKYPAGALSVAKTVSEDGVATYRFTDKAGHDIMSRVVTETGYSDTYHVYDARYQLRAVITPAAVEAVNEADSLSEAVFHDLCYGYGYDHRGRCIEDSKPGTGVTTTIYSPHDYPLFVQSPQLAAKGKWKFDIPDIFGRCAITGIIGAEEDLLRYMAESDIYASFSPSDSDGDLYNVQNAPFRYDELHQAFYYDDYSFLDKPGSRSSGLAFDPEGMTAARRDTTGSALTCRGKMTGGMTRNLDTGEMMLSAIYYDIYGNVIQTRSENVLGGISCICAEYDFQGHVIREAEVHAQEDGSASVLTRCHEYDRAGRLLETVTDLDGIQVVTGNTYDPLGRLQMTVVTSGEVADTTTRSYNVRGWQTGIQNAGWSAHMRYNDPVLPGSEPYFTGNISEWEWTRGENTDAYSLSYDDLSRITGSRLFRNGTPSDALAEKDITYDHNGNILTLRRTGEDGLTVMDLAYGYDGNRLRRIADCDVLSQEYAYDADGNMTFDGRTGMALEWNDLGLVEKVCQNDTVLVNYSYLADGTKVCALDGEGDGLLYSGSLIYKKAGNSIELESAAFAGGRFVAKESTPGVSGIVPMIHVTDHLGSVRAVIDGTTGNVVETNDYYPFGLKWNMAGSVTDQTNRFRYNSKEEQSSLYPASVRNDVRYIDYGARQYDPIIGRWFAQDPLAEKYYSISPYAFCAGNPVKYIDPDGEAVETIIDVASIAVGVGSFVKNVRSGNVEDAIGDAIGVAADAIAAFVPFVPGGVGLARNGVKAAKVANTLDNAADAAKTVENVADATTDAAKAGDRMSKLREKAAIGQEAHRQIEAELEAAFPGTEREVRVKLPPKKIVRKDAKLPDGTYVIIKPDTPSGRKAATKREKLMQDHDYKTQVIFYNPEDTRWLPGAPMYVGPKRMD